MDDYDNLMSLVSTEMDYFQYNEMGSKSGLAFRPQYLSLLASADPLGES